MPLINTEYIHPSPSDASRQTWKVVLQEYDYNVPPFRLTVGGRVWFGSSLFPVNYTFREIPLNKSFTLDWSGFPKERQIYTQTVRTTSSRLFLLLGSEEDIPLAIL